MSLMKGKKGLIMGVANEALLHGEYPKTCRGWC